jgi:short-subunit dehydrogenase
MAANIIITGSSKGIGFEMARLFAENGNNTIIAIARNEDLLARLKDECQNINPGATLIPLPFDLSHGNFENDLIPRISKEVSRVDVLVNNAGWLVNETVADFTEEQMMTSFAVNVFAPMKLVKLLSSMMGGEKGSHIVNIGSMAGFQGSDKFPGLSLYSATKGAIAAFTECLAVEFKDRNIRVNCLALGAVNTEMLQQAFPGLVAQVEPREMAAYIVDFCLNKHQFINGKVIPVSLQ